MGLPSRLTDWRDGKEFSVSIAAQLSILHAPHTTGIRTYISVYTDGTERLIANECRTAYKRDTRSHVCACFWPSSGTEEPGTDVDMDSQQPKSAFISKNPNPDKTNPNRRKPVQLRAQ